MNNYQPYLHLMNSKTGDFFQVNKGFIFNMLDNEDTESDSQNKFYYLAESA